MNVAVTGPEVQPYIAPGSVGNMATHHTISAPTVQTSAHQIAAPSANFQPPQINFSQPTAPSLHVNQPPQPVQPGFTFTQPPQPALHMSQPPPPTVQLNQPQPPSVQINQPAQPTLNFNQPPPPAVPVNYPPSIVANGPSFDLPSKQSPPVVQASPSEPTQQDRYDSYLDDSLHNYKYNFFSVIDEPWNRCISGKKCGKFPGNECIARDKFHQYWQP